MRRTDRGDPTLPTSTDTIPAQVRAAARAAADKLADDIVLLDVGDVMGITDWFVVASGSNTRQVKTIADEVAVAVKRTGADAPRVEGRNDASWVLLDFGDLVVHVFRAEVRDYYGLDRLWSDVPRIEWSEEPDERLAAGL